MSPAQLQLLKKLSQLFEEGSAGPEQIAQLSELLSIINQRKSTLEEQLIFSDASIVKIPS